MELKLIFFIAAVFLVIAYESSAQNWQAEPRYSQAYPGNSPNKMRIRYQFQRRQNQRRRPQVTMMSDGWVCRNTKTNDIMIIASKDFPLKTDGSQGQYYPQEEFNNPQQQPNYPQYQPNDAQQQSNNPQQQPNYPQYQPIDAQEEPNNPQQQPNYPQSQPNEPQIQSNYPDTSERTQDPPNTNGEGIIDVRMGG